MRYVLVLATFGSPFALWSQLTTLPGTTLRIQEGTTLQVDATWHIAAGANVQNNGTVILLENGMLEEAPGAPIHGSGTEQHTALIPAGVPTDPAGLGLTITPTVASTITVERGHAVEDHPTLGPGLARWFRTHLPSASPVTYRYDPVEATALPALPLALFSRSDAMAPWIELSTTSPSDNSFNGNLPEGPSYLTVFRSTGTHVPTSAHRTFVVAPNPATAPVRFIGLDDRMIERVEVYTVDGRLVHSATPFSNADDLALDLGHLASGVHVLRINGSLSSTVIVP